MKTTLHLISAPWALRFEPSVQIGCLKAHIDRKFSGVVETKNHSAFLTIFYEFQKSMPSTSYDELERQGEYPYLLLLCGRSKVSLPSKFPSHEALEQLERATDTFIDAEIRPSLIKDGINVIGFTLNFDQLYSSLYLEKRIRARCRGKKLLFLYGGYGANCELSGRALAKLGGAGYRVFGEGERKLEKIIGQCVDAKTMAGAEKTIGAIDGVVPIQKSSSRRAGSRSSTSHFASQIEDLSELPLPDYDDFFRDLEKYKKADPFFARSHCSTTVSLEGTRGCFAQCDFCALNSQWSGFRKMDASDVYRRTIGLRDKYGVSDFLFLDNVCDTWAERFAETAIDEKPGITFFMELRAHHPETFWTKLSLAGLTKVQIGVEALAHGLLKNMGKGTRVIQNLKVQKYLTELGVISSTNLITHHPKSTVEDVNETRRILEYVPHFPQFKLACFMLFYGSPLYENLPASVKAGLKPYPRDAGYKLPKLFEGCPTEPAYILPDELQLKDDVVEAWNGFRKWLSGFYASTASRDRGLTVTKTGDSSAVIVDNRFGKKKRHALKGLEARIYDFCHKGATVNQLMKLGAQVEVREILSWFIRERLVLEVEGFYLSLALRPKTELISNLTRNVSQLINEPAEVSLPLQ